MMVIAGILGIAAVLAFIGVVISGVYAIQQPLPVIERVFLVGVFSGGCFGALYLLYFVASWLPLDLDSCRGMMECSANSSLEALVNSRWQSALAAAIGFGISVLCFTLGFRHSSKREIRN